MSRIFLALAIVIGILVAATSEARGTRAPHKIPKDHKHKNSSRCMVKDKWIPGCK